MGRRLQFKLHRRLQILGRLALAAAPARPRHRGFDHRPAVLAPDRGDQIVLLPADILGLCRQPCELAPVTLVGQFGCCSAPQGHRPGVLGLPESFGQRDLAGTGDVAATALDAVIKTQGVELVEIRNGGGAQQVLGQQPGRAGLGAIAAANARPFPEGIPDLVRMGRDDTVARLGDRNIVAGSA